MGAWGDWAAAPALQSSQSKREKPQVPRHCLYNGSYYTNAADLLENSQEQHTFIFKIFPQESKQLRTAAGRQAPRTMNSWPSTRASPLQRCSSVIQWCISSGASALQCSTRLAVMITNELGLRDRVGRSKGGFSISAPCACAKTERNASSLAAVRRTRATARLTRALHPGRLCSVLQDLFHALLALKRIHSKGHGRKMFLHAKLSR